ncbi:unnamed protein product [Orchesella dallaii]|uniref:EGF-like domain-containing protein n=1 Tax=Orchesella dallaii TaxID=48710 RepID=A0ABP1R867_9HEXA
MPVLSLPLPRLSTGILEYLPIRVPFPFMRIASILPQAINEPIRISLMALFKLAWSAKVQLPVLITVCFMAFDIRLQLEINIFWENNVRQHAHAAYGYQGANNREAGQRRASREDMRRTALMASALYQQQRRRLIQEIRAQQVRQREAARRPSLPLQVKINAPLATAEDSDLEESYDHNNSDAVTCSHASIVTEDGSIETEEETEGGATSETVAKKKKKKCRTCTASQVVDDDDDEDGEDYEDENDDDFDDDTSSDDDDDESDDLGGSSRGGYSSHGGGNGLDDPYDHDDDDLGDNSYGDSGGGYSSPLVVEVEIRHRADTCNTDGEGIPNLVHVLIEMRLRTWAAVFLLLHNLLSSTEGALKKRINYQPTFMSADDVVSYFKSFISKTSSFARVNEAYYSESFSEDLYHKIDNFISSPQYIKWLMKVKEITDKSNPRGGSTLDSYQTSLNAPCNNLTVFTPTLPTIMRNWVGEKTLVLNDLEAWIISNKNMPPSEMCNRFKGLTCQNKIALDPEVDQGKSVEPTNYTTCQCAQDPVNVGFFKPAQRKKEYSELAYPPACYVRPWRPCHYLSMDTSFKSNYYDWHKDLENEKRILAQIMFPIGRTHRCKEDTVCLDMIPGMKRPICWCNANSMDKTCKTPGKFKVPVGTELVNIRKRFVQIIINANDTTSACTPEHNTQVLTLVKFAGKDPTRTGAMEVMKQLADRNSNARICDFRADLMCNPVARTCRGNLNCDQGKIHVGMGVCVVENGFPCQTDEDCVSNAKCKHFKGIAESACVCQEGYGEKCELKKAAFFGTRFLPIVSGFREQNFLKLQIEINSALESWEHTMSLMEGDGCDPSEDKSALELVNFFGSLEEYDMEKGTNMLRKAHQITREISRSCRYSNFLHCDVITSRCVPMHGKKVLSSKPDASGDPNVIVEVGHDEKCIMEMPPVFHSVVNFVCPRGYFCKKSRMDGTCAPDCDSVFAPPNECPKSKPGMLDPEKSSLANEDPGAQVLPREASEMDTTTVADSEDPVDGQQKTEGDNEGEDSQKDSLSSALMEGNEASNEISGPENKEKDDMTKVESNTPNQPGGDTQNDVGGKPPNGMGEDEQNNSEGVTQDDSEGEAQSELGENEQNDLGGDVPNVLDEDSQNDSEEDVQNNMGGDELTSRLLNCAADEIKDPNNPKNCIKCPGGAGPNAFQTTCICLAGFVPDPSGNGVCNHGMGGDTQNTQQLNELNELNSRVLTCAADEIKDPNDPTKCIKCPSGAEPNAFQTTCICLAGFVPDPSGNGVCNPENSGVLACPADEIKDPANPGNCIPCPSGNGHNSDETTCICIPGYVPDPAGTKECKPCSTGHTPDTSNPPMCKICDTGFVVDINNPNVCVECNPNEVTGVEHDVCTPCASDQKPDAKREECVCNVPGQKPDHSGTCNFPTSTDAVTFISVITAAPTTETTTTPTTETTTNTGTTSTTEPYTETTTEPYTGTTTTPSVTETTINPMLNGSSTTDGMTNWTVTYPTRPPAPTPVTNRPPPAGVGTPCISSGDCGSNNNLVCKDRRCACLMGLIVEGGPKESKECRIPLDHLCGETGLKALQSRNPGQPIKKQAVCSHGTTCSKVNDGMYCRQNKDDGYIIIGKHAHEKKGKKNSGNTISMELARGWKQLSALVVGIMLTFYN